MQFRVSPKTLENYSAEEWQARVDLAAAHRLAFNQGFSEGIFNHLTLVVPGHDDRYYQIPFGTHWSEVTASSFMEVGIDDGKVKRGEGEVERSCFCIHAPIHKALPQAKAVFHTHMPYASALTRLEDPRIKEIGQTEVGMSGAIATTTNTPGPLWIRRKGLASPGSSATRRYCSWPITASARSARPSPTPMTGFITSSAPRRFRSTRCGRDSRLSSFLTPLSRRPSAISAGPTSTRAQRRRSGTSMH